MVIAHSSGVPIDGPAAAGSAAAASRDVGDMGLLKTWNGLEVSFTAPASRAAPHRDHHRVVVLTGASLGSTPLVRPV